MNYLVDAEWLFNNHQQTNIRIIDCRFHLADVAEGKNQYDVGHIPNSVYLDLDKDLSGSIQEHGGRHPLPEWDTFKEKLENIGVSENTVVVAYDNGEHAFAGRLWWLLSYMGHEKVYILNGGYQSWVEKEFPITCDVVSFEKTSMNLNWNTSMIADYEAVNQQVKEPNPNIILIDSREHKRYIGEIEPIDKIAGHIPGAINKVWADVLEEGRFKKTEELKKNFQDLDPNKTYIVYCGSGVTATPNYIALKDAGFPHVKLYPGSYSDWISYDNPIEKGWEKSI